MGKREEGGGRRDKEEEEEENISTSQDDEGEKEEEEEEKEERRRRCIHNRYCWSSDEECAVIRLQDDTDHPASMRRGAGPHDVSLIGFGQPTTELRRRIPALEGFSA